MIFKLRFSDKFEKQISKLDRQTQVTLLRWLVNRIDGTENPRLHGKALTGDKRGLWRYRVGNYRVICEIQDEQLIVLALEVGHRREIYK
ncbi:MAG: type II toxin-antitoxin system RelE/ParE family toxin [Veillonella sp.]|nr:type II toxin-antitoxin system RelE/ParE family toxin [Veillonella sp.]MCF0156764.1 type II toxin-antitoxin system RelE/ParE family toxin [Veillonella sp.]